jgi:hypothetical protein
MSNTYSFELGLKGGWGDWLDERLSCIGRLAANPSFGCPGGAPAVAVWPDAVRAASLDATERRLLTHLPTRPTASVGFRASLQTGAGMQLAGNFRVYGTY